MHSTLARAKLIKALTVGLAAGFFFVAAAPNAAAKEKRQTATAETCPLPFCTTNPGKSCTTTSDPNLSYFCGIQKNTPFRKQAVPNAAAREKRQTATTETCPLPFCTTNPGKSCKLSVTPICHTFTGLNKIFRSGNDRA